jgi:hypothetical protein
VGDPITPVTAEGGLILAWNNPSNDAYAGGFWNYNGKVCIVQTACIVGVSGTVFETASNRNSAKSAGQSSGVVVGVTSPVIAEGGVTYSYGLKIWDTKNGFGALNTNPNIVEIYNDFKTAFTRDFPVLLH